MPTLSNLPFTLDNNPPIDTPSASLRYTPPSFPSSGVSTSGTPFGPGMGEYGPTDVFNPNTSSGVTSNDIASILQSILGNQQTPQAIAPAPVTIDPNAFKVTPINEYQKQVQADPQFQAYYKKLLAQAQGDVNEAIRIMKYQYETGTARIEQDAALQAGRTTEDLTSSLQKLGITFGQEKDSALDTLNKRGIALTQAGGPGSASTQVAPTAGVSYDANGNPTYSDQGGGRAGTELAMLGEDQRLRREATQRTAQRTLQDIGIKKQQGLQDTSEKQQETSYSIGSNAAKTQDQIQQEEEQASLQRAQLAQTQDIQKQQTALQKAQLQREGINV